MPDIFEHSRAVPELWQEELGKLCPGENVSTLVIHWLAGTEREPVQRFAVWEVLPSQAIGKIIEEEKKHGVYWTEGLWKDLQGPDPRVHGKWVQIRGQKTWRSKSMVSREQWDLHRATGGFPFLCWIIEGTKGGHAWRVGKYEQAFLLESGLSPEEVLTFVQEWPKPGSQVYADYDQRVFNALAERDLITKWTRAMSWDDRAQRTNAGLVLLGDEHDRQTRIMERTLRWLEGQIGDAVSDVPRSMLPAPSDFQAVENADDEEVVHTTAVEG